MTLFSTNRRGFITTSGILSIGFTIGAGWMNNLSGQPPDHSSEQPVNAWLQVLENGWIEVRTGKMELGQGILTAIQQVAAEELNCSMDLISIRMADTDLTPNEGYTAGSMSIETSAMQVRAAAATAREMLIQKAATNWGQKTTEIQLENGLLKGINKQTNIRELLNGEQLQQDIHSSHHFYGKSRRKLVGQPIPRSDLEEIVLGKPHFVQDLRLPNMLHARIVRPPGYGSKIISIDEMAIRQLPGLAGIVHQQDFLALLSKDEFRTIQLLELVKPLVQWSPPAPLPADTAIRTWLKSLPTETAIEKESTQWEELTSQTLSAAYFKPYIMHGAMGPSCSVALYKNNQLRIWTHSQGVFPLRKAIAGLVELDEKNIHITGMQGAGCFGHNGADDVAADAAIIAVANPGKAIRLQWMREEEHAWEPYSTPMLMELNASLSTEGKIIHWQYELWSDIHGTRPGGNANNLLTFHAVHPDKSKAMTGYKGGAIRNAEPYYTLGQVKIVSHIFNGPLRRSSLRALGAYGNIFAIESFMDELAVKANKHPVTFRMAHSTDPRALACLGKILELTANIKTAKDEGIGYAFSRYKNSAAYCAVAALVQTTGQEQPILVKKMWAVVDAGECINPDGLKNQIEGGMLQSISWALLEEVRFDTTHITSIDWNSYPIRRFQQAPKLEVLVIDNTAEKPLGAGEAAQGPATAALVNAIYAASGQRIRELPIRSLSS